MLGIVSTPRWSKDIQTSALELTHAIEKEDHLLHNASRDQKG